MSHLLEDAYRKQGMLYGKLLSLGFDNQLRAVAENLTRDVVYSSEIEGIKLNVDEVRSSIARKLGLDNVNNTATSRYVDSVVSVMLEAISGYDRLLTKEMLCNWQAALFPAGSSEGIRIEVGKYRTNEEHIVSGMFGREKIHYIAPGPERLEHEMQQFIEWFNAPDDIGTIVRSAIAHLWFVSIHPFEDGNGRLARILSEILLARGERSDKLFYNVSSQINRDKKHYYNLLEKTQRGDGDVTDWVVWYVSILISAIEDADSAVSTVLNKSHFWQRAAVIPMNERQIRMLNLFLDGYEAKITSKTWASLAGCSKDTAIRDIQFLVANGVLCEVLPGAKRPNYAIIYDADDITHFFSNVALTPSEGKMYLTALYRGATPVRERVLPLDAELYARGDMSLSNLINKYFSYLL